LETSGQTGEAKAGVAGKEIRAARTTEIGNPTHRAAFKEVNKKFDLSADLPCGCDRSDFNSGILSHWTEIWQRFPAQHRARPIHARNNPGFAPGQV
jgi:hypothetical protein